MLKKLVGISKWLQELLDQIQPLNVSQTHSVCLNLPPNNQRVNY